MRPVPSTPLVGPFADRLLTRDFPGLLADRRAAAVAFTIRRVDGLPSVMRLGVLAVASVVRALGAVAGHDRVLSFLVRTPLPLLGEYVRLVRSLGYAYVFETWPDTRADGSDASVASDGPDGSGGTGTAGETDRVGAA